MTVRHTAIRCHRESGARHDFTVAGSVLRTASSRRAYGGAGAHHPRGNGTARPLVPALARSELATLATHGHAGDRRPAGGRPGHRPRRLRRCAESHPGLRAAAAPGGAGLAVRLCAGYGPARLREREVATASAQAATTVGFRGGAVAVGTPGSQPGVSPEGRLRAGQLWRRVARDGIPDL